MGYFLVVVLVRQEAKLGRAIQTSQAFLRNLT